MNLRRMQAAIAEQRLDGWLLYDFHGSNPVARGVLGFQALDPPPKTTRRWFYWVPATGEPVKLVHRLEPHALDHLPGSVRIYLTWGELDTGLTEVLKGAGAVAMEFSPRARLPYVSRLDAGTWEMVRGAGVEVRSSADLAQRFEGTLDEKARLSHVGTASLLGEIMMAAFQQAREGTLTELGLQRWMLQIFDASGLRATDPPTVAVNEHSGDAHFSNTAANDRPIRRGDFLLLDAWAKSKEPGSIYADYTQVAFLGSTAPEAHRKAFEAVRDARDRAIAYVREELAAGRAPRGCDVDDAARDVIRARGWADRFIHRTGHSIGEEVHGNGVHLDNLETRDERLLIDGTLVSVEPGVYFEEFGVRTEVNLLIDGREALVTPETIQTEILLLEP